LVGETAALIDVEYTVQPGSRASVVRSRRDHGWLTAGLLVMLSQTAAPAELKAYGVLTSDYVFRGVSYSDGHPAVQAGLDVSADSGLYAGAWASTVDLTGGPNQRDAALNFYAGFHYAVNDDWTLGSNVVAYTFPGASGPVDYDFTEVSVSASYRDRYWLEYSYTPDLYHTNNSAQNLEVYGEWPLSKTLLFGAGAGVYDVARLSGDDYSYWQAGITRPIGRWSIDLRYHQSSRAVRFISTPDRAKARLALSVRVAFSLGGT
jgi:uncharacterized protein (TIGR02001 family)